MQTNLSCMYNVHDIFWFFIFEYWMVLLNANTSNEKSSNNYYFHLHQRLLKLRILTYKKFPPVVSIYMFWPLDINHYKNAWLLQYSTEYFHAKYFRITVPNWMERKKNRERFMWKSKTNIFTFMFLSRLHRRFSFRYATLP